MSHCLDEALGLLLREIDSYPIDGDVGGRAIEEQDVVQWFRDARRVGDLDLDEAERNAHWSIIIDISDNPGLFMPSSLAMLKQILLHGRNEPSDYLWNLCSAVSAISGSTSYSWRWRLLMGCGLCLVLPILNSWEDGRDDVVRALQAVLGID